MQFVIQFIITDGDDYFHTITAPIIADSKEDVVNVIKAEMVKDTDFWAKRNEHKKYVGDLFTDICGERIFGEEIFSDKKYFRILTLEEWFQISLKGDEWINNQAE